MGAWGEGMQAGDTAWDAIGGAGFDVNGRVPKYKLKKFEKDPKLVAGHFKGWVLKEPMAILGLAEYFVDSGVDIKPVKTLVKKAIRYELTKGRLGCWRDSDARKAALERFRDRVDGKQVDMQAVEADNEGLMSKIGKFLEGKAKR